MAKLRKSRPTTRSFAAQILSAFAFAAALALAFATESLAAELEQGQHTNGKAAAFNSPRELPQVHARWKRDLTGDLFDTAEKFGIGGSYIRKFRALLEGTPPTVREAFMEGDFSNVTEADIRGMNVSVLEYVPPNLIEKMASVNLPLLTPFIEKFLDGNRPNALGRLMSVAGDSFDSNTLIEKVKEHGGIGDKKNAAAGVLLYNALNKLGDKDGITTANLKKLAQDELLKLVPEEQLMKVKDPAAAQYLLKEVYAKASGTEHDDVDDKALIFQLVSIAHGQASDWTTETLSKIQPKILSQMPPSALKSLNPDVVFKSIASLRNAKFEHPLQGKMITDVFMEKVGYKKDEEGNLPEGGAQKLSGIISSLGNLAAFVNPTVTNESIVYRSIINACDRLNLPAPLQAVTNYIKSKTRGKKFEDLGIEDVKELGISVLKNGPPELMNQALTSGSLTASDLKDIGNVRQDSGGLGNSFLQGLISQVAGYAVKFFTQGGKIDFANLPGAFLGALGIRGVNNMSDRDLEDALDQLKNNPDSMDEAQKALLLKRLKEAGMLDSSDLPPHIRALLPRNRNEDLPDGIILDGLPSDSEHRLAHGQGKRITAKALEADPLLVGTLTPKQVNEIDIADIPGVLAAVRKSKDGPQPQALKALANRFKEYIQLKSEDYDSPDKKLLKHITAAEVSKLPATVLAYFVDPRQTKKLPDDVRKEIMIALGELSTKDHASIPAKTREEIILQGLAAIDKKLDGEKKLGVPELAAIGAGVADLPPNRIETLTPVAVEQALEVIQGMADDDDDGLKQRACLSQAQKKAWREKIVEIYGNPDSWDPATVSSLCCNLALLEEDDLHIIPKESIVTCRCQSDEPPPSHLKDLKDALDANCKHEIGVDPQEYRKNLEKVKSEISFDLDDLESQILRRRRRRDTNDDPLNCYVVRIIGTAAPFDKEQIESIPDKDVHNCIYELGKAQLSQDISRSLWEKLVRNKERVENIPATDLHYAGFVLSGIKQEDVAKLDFSDPDIVAAFGRPLGLSKTTLERLANHLEEKSKKSLQNFSSTDLSTAKNIMCGFSPEKLREIKSEAFVEALPVLKSIDHSCELTRLASLAAIVTREDVLGDPKNWTSADVRGAGILVNGLPDVTAIPPEAFLGITPTVAESLSQDLLKNLSPEQLSYVPRFSAQALSEEQLSSLSAEGHNAMDIQGPLVTDSSNTFKISSAIFAPLVIAAIFAHRIL